MKKRLLAAFFAAILGASFESAFARASGNGGDVVRNGGGLSEQALLYSSLHYRSFSARCLQNSTCASYPELQSALKKVQACTLPSAKDFRFQTPKENSQLQGKIYFKDQEGKFVVNREALYAPNALRFPTAMAYLARIYFDACGALAWNESAQVVAPLVTLAEYDGEQITVGKDSIRLPSSQWIRVRSLFSDLMIETSEQVVSLSCPRQDLNACGVLDSVSDVNPKDSFKYLSLANEELVGKRVIFSIEGYYLRFEGMADYFNLKVETENGKVLNIEWMGKPIHVPEDSET